MSTGKKAPSVGKAPKGAADPFVVGAQRFIPYVPDAATRARNAEAAAQKEAARRRRDGNDKPE